MQARQLAWVLAAGVLAISAGSIFARLAQQAAGAGDVGYSLVICGVRLAVATLLLAPVWRGVPGPAKLPAAWRSSCLAGLCMGVHFAAWISSLAYTSIVASTTLVTSTPVWVALIGWIAWGDRPTHRTAAGIAVAIAGGLIVGLAQTGDAGAWPLLGNGLAVLGAIAGACYFLLGRRAQQAGFSVGAHAVVAYATGALLVAPLPWLFGAGYGGHPWASYGWIVLMALFPQVVGHTCFNWAMRHGSPVVVSLVLLAEPVGASVLAYLIFGETIGLPVLAGAATLLAGVALAVTGAAPRERAAS
ncbi:MAG: DMT family transporter [Myxococcales bacterium]|nr:DMT family transporter [Myxococcales bacterium]